MKSPTREKVNSGVAIWSTVHETAIGGFKLDTSNLTAGALISPGTPVTYDESTRIAKIVKMAVLFANATNVATTYQVAKGQDFKVGEYFGALVGGTASTITVVDTSNAGYDVLTVNSTLGIALTAGQGLFQSQATGANAAAIFGGSAVKGLLYEETVVETGVSVSVVLRGTLYARRVPALANTSLQSALPMIIFSQSY